MALEPIKSALGPPGPLWAVRGLIGASRACFGLVFGLFAASFGAIPAQSQSGAFNSACFGGLSDADSPAAIGPCEAQDALNVESNLGGTAILKRKGYSLFADLTISTGPVTGSHSFIDSSGNRKDIVCQDLNCAASTNGNAFATFLTTAATGIVRWSWVDVGGVAYGANNKYDKIVRYDGTTRTSAVGVPLGSILEMTQDRMVVGDISGSPNRVHHSSAGAFENFTVGVNPEDSFFDDVGAAGDKIRGLKYSRGNLYIFKTASVTSCELADQYNTRCSVILPNLGTTDPASIITAGDSLYFRGQDKNYWEISSQGVRSISAKIPNLVKSQSGGLGGGENSNTQTTQADWENGTERPVDSWNTVTTPGSIFPSSTTRSDTDGPDFASGTLVSVSTRNISGSLVLNTSTLSFTNGEFTAGIGQNWTNVGGWVTSNESMSACPPVKASGRTAQSPERAGTSHTYTLSVLAGGNIIKSCSVVVDTPSEGYGKLNSSTCDVIGHVVGSSMSFASSGAYGIGTSTLTANTLAIRVSDSASNSMTSSYGIAGKNALLALGVNRGAAGNSNLWICGCELENYVSSGNITSQIFDTAFTTPTWGPFTVTMTTDSQATATFQVQSSTSPLDTFETLVSQSNVAKNAAAQRRYVRYKASLETTISTKTPNIQSVVLQAATTGQFISQCIQPNTSITAWGTLSCAQTLVGGGSEVFFATSAATCAALPTADPTTWATTATNNATLTVATNTAVKYAWRSLMSSSTDQAQVDACTLAWNEGTAAQPVWAVYDSIKNAVYWTTTINSASSANRLLKYDRNLEQWYPFDIKAQAPRMITNKLYFGGASSGTWNLYGDVDADIGGAINAFWKSKDIGGDFPFQEKGFKTLSILSRNQQAGSMTGTYTFSSGQTGSYTISLSTGAGNNYARNNFNLPLVSPYNFMNVKFGNNSATPFEVLGIGVTWETKPWRVSGP